MKLEHSPTKRRFDSFDQLQWIISVFFRKTTLLLLLLLGWDGVAKNRSWLSRDDGLIYDQILVKVIIEGIQPFYLDALYTNKHLLYIDIEGLFKTIRIPCHEGSKLNTLEGFTDQHLQKYLLDFDTKEILVGGDRFRCSEGLEKIDGVAFVESTLLDKVFKITLLFNLRTLSAELKTNFELPVVKQQRIEKNRDNLIRTKGEVPADTIVKRNFHLMKFGTFDWMLASSQTMGGPTSHQIAMGIGSEFLHGATNLLANYDNRFPWNSRQLSYSWEMVNDNRSLVKRVRLGKIYPSTIAFIDGSLIGATLANSPVFYHPPPRDWDLNELTNPGAIVELYRNGVMIDYVKANEKGEFSFKVPLGYGYSAFQLCHYSKEGDVKSESRVVNRPLALLPSGKIQYQFSAGMVQGSSHGRLVKADCNWGVKPFLSIGGGLEWLSSLAPQDWIPSFKIFLQPLNRLLLGAECAAGVSSRGKLNYSFSRKTALEMDWVWYTKGQRATMFNADQEKHIKLSFPLQLKPWNGLVRFDYTQLNYNALIYRQAIVMTSAYWRRLGTSIATQLHWIDQQLATLTTDIALSYRTGNGYTFRFWAQAGFIPVNMITGKMSVEKQIHRGSISFGWERDVRYGSSTINLMLHYDLKAVSAMMTGQLHNGQPSFTQTLQGGVALGGGVIRYDHRPTINQGGLLLCPFLDLNHNGRLDAGEPGVRLPAARVAGTLIRFDNKEGLPSVGGLTIHSSVMVDLDDRDLEQIAWRFAKKRYQVTIDPNQYKPLEIPVVAVGQVSGTVYQDQGEQLKGIGGIRIELYRKGGNKKVAEIWTGSDGYFEYLGLNPGDWVARLDTSQLNELSYMADKDTREFKIIAIREGDRALEIDFTIKAVNQIPMLQVYQEPAKVAEAKLSQMSHPLFVSVEAITISKDTLREENKPRRYEVQFFATRKAIDHTEDFLPLLRSVSRINILESKGKDGLFHYSTGAFTSLKEAREFLTLIRKMGWKNGFVAIYRGSKEVTIVPKNDP